MARPLRIEYEYAIYHVYARGHRRENIFLDDTDRKKFMEKLSEVIEKFQILVHCYVLMDNHYHLLITTPNANLSRKKGAGRAKVQTFWFYDKIYP